jgi:Holliday junction resolvase
MLERSGYTVCSYGYEDTLLDAMSKRTSQTSNSETGRRIRKSPDLLVYEDKNIMLLEVKTRGKSPPYIRAEEINNLKEFWNDSILAFVVPDGNVFYAKRTDELKTQPNNSYVYYALSDFEKFQEIFKRVQTEGISHYKEIVLRILQIFMTEKEKKALENTPLTIPQNNLCMPFQKSHFQS